MLHSDDRKVKHTRLVDMFPSMTEKKLLEHKNDKFGITYELVPLDEYEKEKYLQTHGPVEPTVRLLKQQLIKDPYQVAKLLIKKYSKHKVTTRQQFVPSKNVNVATLQVALFEREVFDGAVAPALRQLIVKEAHTIYKDKDINKGLWALTNHFKELGLTPDFCVCPKSVEQEVVKVWHIQFDTPATFGVVDNALGDVDAVSVVLGLSKFNDRPTFGAIVDENVKGDSTTMTTTIHTVSYPVYMPSEEFNHVVKLVLLE